MSDVFGLISESSGPVPLEGLRVIGSILGRGARVKVVQRFRNAEAGPVEAVYRFPLPESAAVCGLAAVVGGRRISGAVEEREKAFETYDGALARGDGAYLLDQGRPNIFTLSVGNLPAGAEVVVEIEYVILLDQRGQEVRFSLPTTISPRYLPADTPDEEGIPVTERIHPAYAASVPYGLTLEIDVRDAADVESVASPSHSINVALEKTERDSVMVRFASDTVRMDRDFVLTITRKTREPGRVWRSVDERGTWLQLDMALDESCGQEVLSSADPGSQEVIFVLDCSGSMDGDSINQAKRALEVCLRALERHARFNVVRFGSTFQSLFPQPRQYEEESMGEALGWLKAVNADLGGTEVLAPLRQVYSGSPANGARRSVVLLTDGEVGNEAEVMELVRAGAPATRFFCVGIGAGPNDHLVRGLARAGGGAVAFIFPGERIEPRVLAIFHLAASPVVSGLSIDWGDPAEQAPTEPPLLIGEPMSAWARIRDPRGMPRTVTVKATVGGKPMSWELPIVVAAQGGLPIPTLWARERIRSLEEAAGAGGHGSRQQRLKREAWKQEVMAISREFQLSSSFTSWIAVEEREEKDRQTGKLVLRRVPVLATIGWHGIGGVSGSGVGGPGYLDHRLLLSQGAKASRSFGEVLAADNLNTILAGEPSDRSRGRNRESYPRPRAAQARHARRERVAFRESNEEANTDLLLWILSLQHVDGGFDLDVEAFRRLGLDPELFARAAAGLAGEQALNIRVLSTAAVLAFLEARFADARPTWFSAVKKSRSWLKTTTDGWGAVMEQKTVSQWAQDMAVMATPRRE